MARPLSDRMLIECRTHSHLMGVFTLALCPAAAQWLPAGSEHPCHRCRVFNWWTRDCPSVPQRLFCFNPGTSRATCMECHTLEAFQVVRP